MWRERQFGSVVDDFAVLCHKVHGDLWDEVRVHFALLLELGPMNAGPSVAKKLTNGKGLWELKAKLGNLQPRLLFYENEGNVLVFVYCWIKKGDREYPHAIEQGNKRRRQIAQGKVVNVISTQVH